MRKHENQDSIEVLQALERQHYDVVLMDLKMPEMEGLEATQIIRRRWPTMARSNSDHSLCPARRREKCLAAGMDGYISKPVQKEDPAEVLENLGKRCDI